MVDDMPIENALLVDPEPTDTEPVTPPSRQGREPLRVGATVEFDVFDLSARGDGVGQFRDRELHVPGAFPGERVSATILHLDRQGPRGHALLRSTPRTHPGRQVPPCKSHNSRRRGAGCDGCAMMALDIASQRELRLQTLGDLGLRVDGIIGGEPAESASVGYRWSSKRVAFADSEGRLRLGSYARDSARGRTMAGCLVDHPRIEATFAAIEAACRSGRVLPYDAAPGSDVAATAENAENAANPPQTTAAAKTGDLRWVWIKTNGEDVFVTLITADATSRAADVLPNWVNGVVGWAQSVQPASGNTIRSPTVRRLAGQAALTVSLGGVVVEVGALGFLQPNPAVAARAWADLVCDPNGDACSGAVAADLYAGAGVTTAALRAQFATVVVVESWPESAAALGVAPADAAETLSRWVERLAGAPTNTDSVTLPWQAPDLVVANPPRAGLGAVACAALVALAAERVHIMSCNPASLRRDLDRLDAAYEVVAARAYDTLPHTPHVEVVVWLRRRRTEPC